MILLEISNGDSPPLSELQLSVSGYGSRLIFPVRPVGSASSVDEESQYTLYYGSETARVRDYDLAKLTGSLSKLSTLLPATLGPRQGNPRFQKPQPLPAVPTTGSPLETTGFRMQRPVLMRDGVELYSLLLSPIDLAFLRSDLGDLRVVDEANQQVPYVLVPNDIETRSELQVIAEPSTATDKISRYRLSLVHNGQSVTVPMEALELTVTSSFYRRSVRIREAKSEVTPHASLLCNGTILRLSEEDAGLLEPVLDAPIVTGPLWLGISAATSDSSAARLWTSRRESNQVFQRDAEPATAVQSTKLAFTPMVRLLISAETLPTPKPSAAPEAAKPSAAPEPSAKKDKDKDAK